MIEQCVVVGMVWGLTNALMKYVDYDGKKQFFMNWKWIGAFLLNQCGSLLFYLTLKDSDLSMAVPVCQATTLVFTVIGAWFLGEEFRGDTRWTIIGIVLVSLGVGVMRIDQVVPN